MLKLLWNKSKQISELQKSMEDSISSHVIASMKAQLHDALQENKKNMPMMVAKAMEDQEGFSKGTAPVPKGMIWLYFRILIFSEDQPELTYNFWNDAWQA